MGCREYSKVTTELNGEGGAALSLHALAWSMLSLYAYVCVFMETVCVSERNETAEIHPISLSCLIFFLLFIFLSFLR